MRTFGIPYASSVTLKPVIVMACTNPDCMCVWPADETGYCECDADGKRFKLRRRRGYVCPGPDCEFTYFTRKALIEHEHEYCC